MQITLNQTEIETALRRYVNDQVNVKDGNEIVIDLKAGRGDNGFSAIIDIVPASETVTSSAKPLGLAEKTKPTKPAQTTPTAPTQDAQEASQEAAGEAASETATDAGPEPETPAPATDAGEELPGEDAAEVPAAPRSLFASLGKPRNN